MKKVFLVMSLNNNCSYHFTRHNVGSWWMRYFCLLNDIALFKDDKFSIYFAKINFGNKELFLLEPFTYINLSGIILNKFLSFHSVSYDSILLIHDDLDLNVGDIRLKFGGHTASHNGLNNVIACLQTACFFRLRIGIGNNLSFSRQSYVLSEPSDEEKYKILFSIKCSLLCVDDILNFNFSKFRNNFLFLFNSGG